MKKIIILGATGSIGSQTIDVLKEYHNEFELIGISLYTNISKLNEIISTFPTIQYVCVRNEADAELLSSQYLNIKFFSGNEGLELLAQIEADLLINSLVGSTGLLPTIEAIKKGTNIALANKETLVAAGEIVMSLAKEYGVSILPIDSEHSAILQCIEENNFDKIESITITASGGSFRDKTRAELESVTISEALSHPNWSMGSKITIDSATMMNKGFEVIEAFHLFNLPIEKINTILHKESIVHSMVNYIDGSTLAHLGNADMRTPILYTLSYPKRLEHKARKPFNLEMISSLSFAKLDMDRFPCLKYAYDAIKMGGTIPAVLIAANDTAVMLFLEGKISFLEIEEIIKSYIYTYDNIVNPNINDIIRVLNDVKESILSRY